MSAANISVFDLEFFKGITFELGFQLIYVDADGTPTGFYPDLTGKSLALIFNGVFPETGILVLP